jgi:hypothetical protein
MLTLIRAAALPACVLAMGILVAAIVVALYLPMPRLINTLSGYEGYWTTGI